MGHFLSADTAAALARLTALDADQDAPALERMRAIRAVLLHLDADPAHGWLRERAAEVAAELLS